MHNQYIIHVSLDAVTLSLTGVSFNREESFLIKNSIEKNSAANSITVVQDRYRRFKYQHTKITHLPIAVSHHI